MIEDEWHKDPSNWVLGIFYYNKNDKRIFPPKRITAMGWTVNFANPKSVLVFVLVLVGAAVLLGLPWMIG